MASEEPGGLNESLEVHHTLKCTLQRPCHSFFPSDAVRYWTCYVQHGPSVLRISYLGKRAVSPYCLQHFQGQLTGSHSEGQVNNCLTTQAEIGEITLVGDSTTAKTGPHPFSLPLCMVLAASVSPFPPLLPITSKQAGE